MKFLSESPIGATRGREHPLAIQALRLLLFGWCGVEAELATEVEDTGAGSPSAVNMKKPDFHNEDSEFIERYKPIPKGARLVWSDELGKMIFKIPEESEKKSGVLEESK